MSFPIFCCCQFLGTQEKRNRNLVWRFSFLEVFQTKEWKKKLILFFLIIVRLIKSTHWENHEIFLWKLNRLNWDQFLVLCLLYSFKILKMKLLDFLIFLGNFRLFFGIMRKSLENLIVWNFLKIEGSFGDFLEKFCNHFTQFDENQQKIIHQCFEIQSFCSFPKFHLSYLLWILWYEVFSKIFVCLSNL